MILDKHVPDYIFPLVLLHLLFCRFCRPKLPALGLSLKEGFAEVVVLLKLGVEYTLLVLGLPLVAQLVQVPIHHLHVGDFLIDELLLIPVDREYAHMLFLPLTLLDEFLLLALDFLGLLIPSQLQAFLGGHLFRWWLR